jgi:endonuclease/exonuclease/phosphatase family metal-dependent hydrolase
MSNVKCLILLFAGLVSLAATAETPLTIATWNVGLLDRAASDLDLARFAAEIDADILILNEVKRVSELHAIRDGLGRPQDASVISNFENGDDDLEVGVITRYRIGQVIEFDRAPENNQTAPRQTRLERTPLPGIAEVGVARGFLVVEIPEQGLFIIATHLKSSQGRTGTPDLENARKRELVAAAIATEVNRLLAEDPNATVIVAGDMNVGVSDAAKNGVRLEEDTVSGPGDRYDETHALFTEGLIGGLRMRHLARGLAGTFVGDDNEPDYAGSGAIDAIYVAGADSGRFSTAQRALDRYGSDHLAVYTTTGPTPVTIRPPAADPEPGTIRIYSLLPDPQGKDAGNEVITLENRGGTAVLRGWKFMDGAGNTFTIPDGTSVPPGRTAIRLVSNTMPLNNNGDTIGLLDAAGNLVGDPLAYAERDVVPGREIRQR